MTEATRSGSGVSEGDHIYAILELITGRIVGLGNDLGRQSGRALLGQVPTAIRAGKRGHGPRSHVPIYVATVFRRASIKAQKESTVSLAPLSCSRSSESTITVECDVGL